MFSAIFWRDTAERVVASFAGALLTALGGPPVVNALFPALNVLTVDWKTGLGLAGGAALVSLLKALAASQIGDPQSASLFPSVRAHGKHEKN
jgi:uncharacterized membrane protein YfcA